MAEDPIMIIIDDDDVQVNPKTMLSTGASDEAVQLANTNEKEQVQALRTQRGIQIPRDPNRPWALESAERFFKNVPAEVVVYSQEERFDLEEQIQTAAAQLDNIQSTGNTSLLERLENVKKAYIQALKNPLIKVQKEVEETYSNIWYMVVPHGQDFVQATASKLLEKPKSNLSVFTETSKLPLHKWICLLKAIPNNSIKGDKLLKGAVLMAKGTDISRANIFNWDECSEIDMYITLTEFLDKIESKANKDFACEECKQVQMHVQSAKDCETCWILQNMEKLLSAQEHDLIRKEAWNAVLVDEKTVEDLIKEGKTEDDILREFDFIIQQKTEEKQKEKGLSMDQAKIIMKKRKIPAICDDVDWNRCKPCGCKPFTYAHKQKLEHVLQTQVTAYVEKLRTFRDQNKKRPPQQENEAPEKRQKKAD